MTKGKVIFLLLFVCLYLLSIYVSSYIKLESVIEQYEEILTKKDFNALNKCISKKAKVTINNEIYMYKDIASKVESILDNTRDLDTVSLQISPTLQEELKIYPFSIYATLNCFMESTTENKSAQSTVKLKINRSIGFNWSIVEVDILYYGGYSF